MSSFFERLEITKRLKELEEGKAKAEGQAVGESPAEDSSPPTPPPWKPGTVLGTQPFRFYQAEDLHLQFMATDGKYEIKGYSVVARRLDSNGKPEAFFADEFVLDINDRRYVLPSAAVQMLVEGLQTAPLIRYPERRDE